MSTTFFQIQWKDLLLFTIAFIVFTPIGTVSHECGHVIAAKIRGYETKLHYGSTDWNAEAAKKKLEVLYLENEDDILNNQPFPDKEKMEKIAETLKHDSVFITSGGPIQTMLTGIIGLLLLLFRRKPMAKNGLQLIDWLGVFLSLFWLREVFNIYSSISHKIAGKSDSYFGGDEAWISTALGMPAGVIPIICAFLGSCVFLFILFNVIPIQKRLSFVLGGLVGGFTGLYIWIQLLGPKLLP